MFSHKLLKQSQTASQTQTCTACVTACIGAKFAISSSLRQQQLVFQSSFNLTLSRSNDDSIDSLGGDNQKGELESFTGNQKILLPKKEEPMSCYVL